jgi:hypothetical protein
MPIIHFVALEDLLDELPAGHVVRVVALESTESTSSQYGIRLTGYGVHARAAVDGDVLVWYGRNAQLQLIGSIYPGHGQEKEHTAAWARAEARAEAVSRYIAARGFAVRPGIIDLGDVRPIPGTFPADVLLSREAS